MNGQQFITARKAAEILGLSPKTLLNWRKLGLGPVARRFGGRAVRYSLSDLEAFTANSCLSAGDGE